MNNDRELLELAAKAAGYPTNHPWNAERLLLEPPVIGLCIMGIATNWNPLHDDGDALRLAVKLGICIAPGSNTLTHRSKFAVATGDSGEILEVRGDDPYAATRRAIVRAAAEIGKELP